MKGMLTGTWSKLEAQVSLPCEYPILAEMNAELPCKAEIWFSEVQSQHHRAGHRKRGEAEVERQQLRNWSETYAPSQATNTRVYQ